MKLPPFNDNDEDEVGCQTRVAGGDATCDCDCIHLNDSDINVTNMTTGSDTQRIMRMGTTRTRSIAVPVCGTLHGRKFNKSITAWPVALLFLLLTVLVNYCNGLPATDAAAAAVATKTNATQIEDSGWRRDSSSSFASSSSSSWSPSSSSSAPQGMSRMSRLNELNKGSEWKHPPTPTGGTCHGVKMRKRREIIIILIGRRRITPYKHV